MTTPDALTVSAVVIESLSAHQGVVAAAATKLITQCCIMTRTFLP